MKNPLAVTQLTGSPRWRRAQAQRADDHGTVSQPKIPTTGIAALAALRLAGALALLGGVGLAAAASPAGATTPKSLYASLAGTGNCLSRAGACTLTNALAVAGAGTTIYLTEAGDENSLGTWYMGNWGIALSGTTATSPLTIEPEAGVTSPVLSDETLGGTVLTIGSDTHVDLIGLTFENSDQTAITNDLGGTLTVTDSTFINDGDLSNGHANDNGGAIDNGDGGTGTLIVSGSTFSDNQSEYGDGGAIDNGDYKGTGTATISDSSFSSDGAQINGGAIDNGDNGGSGNLSVTTSTFSGDGAFLNGGAIDSGDTPGADFSVAKISDSTFTEDDSGTFNAPNGASENGGAIDNGDQGGAGLVSILDSTFLNDNAWEDGGAFDNGDQGGVGAATISDSTFTEDIAIPHGGAIDNGDQKGTGSVTISDSTFTQDTDHGGYGDDIDNGEDAGTGTLDLAANIFADTCTNAGVLNDSGYNVGVDGSCENGGKGDKAAASAADLGALADNGGPTETILPSTGNPAIFLVPNPTSITLDGAKVKLCPTTDQRGVASPPGLPCNAGSVQPNSPPAALYAAPAGTGTCVSAAQACSLASALTEAGAGSTIYLTQAGTQGTSSTYYVGNWEVDPSGTSASSPLTIEPEAGVSDPILSGNGGSATNCPTTTCNGAVLFIGGVHVNLSGVTIENADSTASGKNNGGAISNINGGTVTISDSTFSTDAAGDDGGAIDNGDDGSGTLVISDSTFSGDTAGSDGGAIDNGDDAGTGSVTITDSTFSGDSASSDGGAIDNADGDGTGSVTVTTSTLSGNSATSDGGAIDNADGGGNGGLTISDSTFVGNGASSDGGAIDNGDNAGSGTLIVTDSTLASNSTFFDGGAIDNADDSGGGTVVVAASTFSGNSVHKQPFKTPMGGDIASGSGGALNLAANVFADTNGCDNAGSFNDGGYNVGVDATCENQSIGDQATSSAADLEALANNGGPTQTMEPLSTNPAVGVVPFATTTSLGTIGLTLCPTTDQRGVTSPSGLPCDAGSVQGAVAVSPTLTKVSPPSGTTSGGTAVVLTGTNFSNATSVMFGSTSAPFTIVSDTTIDVTAPASSGKVEVVVTDTPGGASATGATTSFTYKATDVEITTASLPGATVHSSYSAQLTASNTGATTTWKATGLPKGLKCSTSGAITGTPTKSGTYNVVLKVTSGSSNDTLTVTLTVNGAG